MNLVCRASEGSRDSFTEAAELIDVDVSFKDTPWNGIINVYTTSDKVGLLYKAQAMLTESVSTQANGKYRFVNKYTHEEIKAACAS